MWLDPPKSPLKRGTLILVPPFLRGVRGDLNVVGLGYKTCVYTVAYKERGFNVLLPFLTREGVGG
jgi:hypothetical protein